MASSLPRREVSLAEVDHRNADYHSFAIDLANDDSDVIWVLDGGEEDHVPVLVSSDEEDEGEIDPGEEEEQEDKDESEEEEEDEEEEPYGLVEFLLDHGDDVDFPPFSGDVESDSEEEDMEDWEEEEGDWNSEDSSVSTMSEESEYSENEDDGDGMRPLSPFQQAFSEDLSETESLECPHDVPVVSVSGVEAMGAKRPRLLGAAVPPVWFPFGRFRSSSPVEPAAKHPKLDLPQDPMPSTSGVGFNTPSTVEEDYRFSAPSTSGLSSSSNRGSAQSASGLNSSTGRSYGRGPFGPRWSDDSDSD